MTPAFLKTEGPRPESGTLTHYLFFIYFLLFLFFFRVLKVTRVTNFWSAISARQKKSVVTAQIYYL